MNGSMRRASFRVMYSLELEALHLAAEADREGRDIEALDLPDAALAFQDGIPRGRDSAADGGNNAQSCNDDATFTHT